MNLFFKKLLNLQVIIITALIIILLYINGIVWFEVFANWLFPANENRNGELIKLLFSIMGGVAILIGLYMSYRRVLAFEKNVLKQNDQIEISRKAQINEQFKNAIEHLGNEKEPVILGGIAELHQIAFGNKEEYSRVVLNILINYVRSEANTQKNAENINKTVIQTILDYVLYTDVYETKGIDLSHCNLRSINFDNSTFDQVNLSFSILPFNLSDITFTDCKLSKLEQNISFFRNVQFYDCDLFGSYFNGVRFHNVLFSGIEKTVNFHFLNCKFQDIIFDYKAGFENKFIACEFKTSKFINIEFLKARFVGTSFYKVSFLNISLSSCEFIACGFNNTVFDKGESFKVNIKSCDTEYEYFSFALDRKMKESIGIVSNLSGLKFKNHSKLKSDETKILEEIEASKILEKYNDIVLNKFKFKDNKKYGKEQTNN